MSNTVNPSVEESITPAYRTLFIGLGGTGGQVLCNLWERMNASERARAHMLYIDTDQKDLLKLSGMGVPSVNIGSSDTVRDVIDYLGTDDRVLDWISANENENAYLSSSTHDGASQYRTKSRLCLAKFLKNSNNELKRMLDAVSVPGIDLSREPLRVMIVSSIAGGTGAGSFIQVALYLRNYFRNHGHKDIGITGMFACPDLFVEGQAVTEDEKVECMYANAYAAVRELNAMNLVVDGGHETRQGYGRSIHIAIDTESEGRLFDSQDPLFTASSNYKPYNLIYLMDVANTSGGVLRTMDQYYRVMADVAYTRLYSPLEGALRSDESNELSMHQNYPTAIYGSAGYGKIIYPYDGVVNFLALQKTHAEMDYTWSILENEWEKYARNEQMKAKASGRRWIPTSIERGNRYVSDMMVAMEKEGSGLAELRPMVKDADSKLDRAAAFLTRLNAALTSASGTETAGSKAKDGIYSLASDEKVAAARKKLRALYDSFQQKMKGSKDSASIIQELGTFSLSAENAMKAYVHAIRSAASGSAYFVSSVVAPRNERDGVVAMNEKDAMNLFHGLLSLDGKAVHPVAARYLLYSLRKQMMAKLSAMDAKNVASAMDASCSALHLALDPNPTDDKPISVSDKMAEISKTFILFRGSEADSAMKKYMQAFVKTMGEIGKQGDKLLMFEVYTRILEVLDILIEKYEGLFDNLDQYRTNLTLELARERDRHEVASDDRCVFINGSRKAKEHLYYVDSRTRDVLDASSEEVAVAAGEGVYNALMKRTWKHMEDAENIRLSDGYLTMEEDTFSDMGDVFDDIVTIYKNFLKKKASHLQVDVVTALIRECCRMVGAEERDLATSTEKRVQVRNCFENVIRNMLSKADPMLNFNNVNSDPYFQQEQSDKSSMLYVHIGLSSKARDALMVLYEGTEATDAQVRFGQAFGISRGLTVNDNISDYEVVSFKAVHCLQPTQVRKFREDYHHGFYYHYKKRLALMNSTRTFSKTPHLDKRWHLREAMPYISHGMDVAWHLKTARAFVFETLNHTLKFTTDNENYTCFIYPQHGQDTETVVRFPGDSLVDRSSISRLLEFLQEDDEFIELKNQQLDEWIETILEKMGKYTESMPVYKSMLTSHPVLRDLRSNLLVYGNVVNSAQRAKKQDADPAPVSEKEAEDIKARSEKLGLEDVDMVDHKKSLGGLLEVAWLVHRSEEKQGRDHDFGECIVECARDIIEKLCQKMCGVYVTPESDMYEEYCDLYNSIVEKFMESYVLSIMRKLGDPDVSNTEFFYRYLPVPEIVRDTAEYKWATRIMPLKNLKDKR